MKQLTVILVSVFLILAVGCQSSDTGSDTGSDSGSTGDTGSRKVDLDSEKAKISYAIGSDMGKRMRNIKEELDLSILFQGFRDGMGGDDKIQMPAADVHKVLQEFSQKMRQRAQEERKAQADKNLAEGEAFLKENATKEGVVTTETGLQYKVLKEGTGALPKATDTVEVHYRGTLLDGTEFDSSYKKGTPAKFALHRVIPAWTEGVQLMKVGSKYMFFVPSKLGYGERGSRSIGPNAVLTFEIELLSIVSPEELKKEQEKRKKMQPPRPKIQKKEAQKKEAAKK